MGFGDDIMSTALARHAFEEYGSKCVFGKRGKNDDDKHLFHWSSIYEGNPYIVQPGEETDSVVFIPEYPGQRYYIDYEKMNDDAFVFNPEARPMKGELFFSNDEVMHWNKIVSMLPDQYVVVEPNTKEQSFSKNKAWPWQKWVELCKALPTVQFVQLGDESVRTLELPNVTRVETKTIRAGIYIAGKSNGVVTTDGAMHHSAAAMNVPAVVLWGHYSSPDILGYGYQNNIRSDYLDGFGCGSFEQCDKCSESMESIPVDQVAEAVKAMVSS